MSIAASACAGLRTVVRADQCATASLYKARCVLLTCARSHRRHVHSLVSTNHKLPQAPARVRFAPSPTGYLHLGSLRTALYNYLLAKRTGGQFILRIEDTDQKRLVRDAEQRLYQDLKWAGLTWDEGPGIGGDHEPYKQSERTSLYQEHSKILLESGAAFRCFCPTDHIPIQHTPSNEDLDQLAHSVSGCQQSCYDLSPDQISDKLGSDASHVVRLAKNTPVPKWKDVVYGNIEVSKKSPHQNRHLPDAVLLKSDGTPTYHLANVVDDHEMKMTHVIRGTEWMSSTALHVALYNAFGWDPPQFVHVGLLTDSEGNKLSKRNMDTDIRSLREQQDILPETAVNFLALLGWRNPGKGDVMTLEDMSRKFDLKFTRGNAVVSLDKLWYLQRHHAKARIMTACLSTDERNCSARNSLEAETEDRDRFRELVTRIVERAKVKFPDMQTVLRDRSLDIHVQAVLFSDPEYYMDAKQYLTRNAFFFDRDTAGAKAPSVERSGTVAEIADELLADPVISEAYEDWETVNATIPSELASMIREGAAKINKRILSLCRERCAGATQEEQEGNKAARALTKQVHDYFRCFLTFGLPSPSTGHVLLVLGRDEVQHRMTV